LQRDNMCRGCRSAYGKAHYEANKPRYIRNAARVKKATRLKRIWHMLDYLEKHPCIDCGEWDPVVLEFDHLRDKSFEVCRARGDGEVRCRVRELPPHPDCGQKKFTALSNIARSRARINKSG